MPVRPRRARRTRHALTVATYMNLTLGPRDATADELEVLRPVYDENRRWFGADDWAVRYFEDGDAGVLAGLLDDDQAAEVDDDLVGLPGVPAGV
ncbi:MAG TPA: hypothetical protein VIJ66_03520 [Solirubrobacteraceae bacterium]